MQLVLLLTLFIFSLNIPGLSFFAIVTALFAIIIKGFSKKSYQKSKRFLSASFLISYLILFAFSLFYYITVYSYNLIEGDIVRTILISNVAYIVGYSIKPDSSGDRLTNYMIPVYLALIAGGVVYVFLSVVNSSTFDIIGRSAPDIWKPSESVNGTVLDLYSMLGTSLLTFIFYSKSLWIQSKRYKLLIVIALSISFLASFTTILLQGRKAILSILVAFTLTTLFKLTSISKKDGRNFYVFLLLVISSILTTTFGSVIEYIAANFDVFVRFKDEGLDSGRYQAWLDILQSMPTHLTGGRSFPISESFAHNIWLDVFYDGGIVPMILLFIFHCLHIHKIFKVLRSNLPQSIIILNICIMVPIFMGFQGEPVLQASTIYFAMTCCFFGLIMRLSQIADESNLTALKLKDENG
jgi:hypothetical protein